ncbi:MAG: FHA domain-containing protein [Lachnospiraceae bacterium]|nr:FHA domain-containing protein [Lachnospiraceae bacterium]
MEIYYGSKGINNYIEAVISPTDSEILQRAYQFRMLEDNNITGIIKPVISKADDHVYLRFPINSLFVLDKYFIKEKPDIRILKALLADLLECINVTESYLLNPSDLVLSPEYMLWDEQNKKINLICVPLYNKEIKNQMKNFMEYIMQVFDYKSPDGIVELHRMYELISYENLGIGEIIKSLDKMQEKQSSFYDEKYYPEDKTGFDNEQLSLKTDIAIKERDEDSTRDNYIHEILVAINCAAVILSGAGYFISDRSNFLLTSFFILMLLLILNITIYFLKKEKEEEIDMDVSMEEFRSMRNEVYDNQSIESQACDNSKMNNKSYDMIPERRKNYKLIPLNDGMLEPLVVSSDKEELVIGRGKRECDYRLDKEQISRIHACISVKDRYIYIEDKNSTNGTYVNSIKLKAYEKIKINAGDIVRLANEEFFVS